MDPQNNQNAGGMPGQGQPQGQQGQNQGQPIPPMPPQGGFPQGAQQGAQPQGGYPPAGFPPQGYPQDPAMYGAYPPGYYPQPGQMPQAPGIYPPAGYPPQAPQGYPQDPAMMGMGMPPQGQGAPQGFPQGAYPQGPYPQQPGMPPYAPVPEDTTPANFQLGSKLPPILKVVAPKHTLDFDEESFIRLLAGSISLSKDEKKRIVDSIPKLKQSQIDELVRIFEEERQKFAALSKKHVPQLEKLAQQHYADWMSLEEEYMQEHKKKDDQDKAEEIRKKLGL